MRIGSDVRVTGGADPVRLVITGSGDDFWLQLMGESARDWEALDRLGVSGIRTCGPATDAYSRG